jgi:DNA-binding transcriptional LysR family regulator
MSAIHDQGNAPGSPEQLASIDLNLLVAFDALTRERSVTRAAARVGVTQSAMSHALRRLRELLGDALLVRGREGMMLTPRAQALLAPVRSGLATLGRAIAEPSVFVPQSAKRAFTLATPDLFDVLAVPSLLAHIRARAPGVDLAIVTIDPRDLMERLETGDVDAAVVARVDNSRTAPQPSPHGLVQTTLFRDRFVCLLRRDHPAFAKGGALTLAKYCALSHALVAPRGTGLGPVDEALAARGKTRRIALRVPHFLSALAIVARSDLVLTAPSPLAALSPPELALAVFPPPLALPDHSVNLLWHERYTNEPSHTWLRDLVAEVAREIEHSLGLTRGRTGSARPLR